jgi:hypothetical protein
MKSNWLAALMLGMSVLTWSISMAHGTNEPKHGGVVATVSDLGFELVGTSSSVLIYVYDHGKPLPLTGMSGKLTALSGAVKSETDLTIEGDKFEAKGVKLVPGMKIVVALTTSNKKAITVRFSIK